MEIQIEENKYILIAIDLAEITWKDRRTWPNRKAVGACYKARRKKLNSRRPEKRH